MCRLQKKYILNVVRAPALMWLRFASNFDGAECECLALMHTSNLQLYRLFARTIPEFIPTHLIRHHSDWWMTTNNIGHAKWNNYDCMCTLIPRHILTLQFTVYKMGWGRREFHVLSCSITTRQSPRVGVPVPAGALCFMYYRVPLPLDNQTWVGVAVPAGELCFKSLPGNYQSACNIEFSTFFKYSTRKGPRLAVLWCKTLGTGNIFEIHEWSVLNELTAENFNW